MSSLEPRFRIILWRKCNKQKYKSNKRAVRTRYRHGSRWIALRNLNVYLWSSYWCDVFPQNRHKKDKSQNFQKLKSSVLNVDCKNRCTSCATVYTNKEMFLLSYQNNWKYVTIVKINICGLKAHCNKHSLIEVINESSRKSKITLGSFNKLNSMHQIVFKT